MARFMRSKYFLGIMNVESGLGNHWLRLLKYKLKISCLESYSLKSYLIVTIWGQFSFAKSS